LRDGAYARTDTHPDRVVVGVPIIVAVTGGAMAPTRAAMPGGAGAGIARVESGDMDVDVTVRKPVASTRLTWHFGKKRPHPPVGTFPRVRGGRLGRGR
jgi:hypothetical protein